MTLPAQPAPFGSPEPAPGARPGPPPGEPGQQQPSNRSLLVALGTGLVLLAAAIALALVWNHQPALSPISVPTTVGPVASG